MITIIRSKNFESNYQKVRASEYCLICGKALINKATKAVRTWLGAEIISAQEYKELTEKEGFAADSGCWLIGNDCAKKIKGLSEYLV